MLGSMTGSVKRGQSQYTTRIKTIEKNMKMYEPNICNKMLVCVKGSPGPKTQANGNKSHPWSRLKKRDKGGTYSKIPLAEESNPYFHL